MTVSDVSRELGKYISQFLIDDATIINNGCYLISTVLAGTRCVAGHQTCSQRSKSWVLAISIKLASDRRLRANHWALFLQVGSRWRFPVLRPCLRWRNINTRLCSWRRHKNLCTMWNWTVRNSWMPWTAYSGGISADTDYNVVTAFSVCFCREIGECFAAISKDEDCRAVILSGSGKHFTAGLDLSDMGDLVGIVMGEGDIARKFRQLQDLIRRYQFSFTSIEQVYTASIHATLNKSEKKIDFAVY